MKTLSLIANWKMNLPKEGVDSFITAMAGLELVAGAEMVIAPPFPYLAQVSAAIRQHGLPLLTGAQNCSSETSGAFTGEVSAAMLRDVGATHVVIGHSERRTIFRETDELIAKKLSLAVKEGLTPVLCIGESLDVREANATDALLRAQIERAAGGVGEASRVIVAYEPIWAIGTGRNATPEIVAAAATVIREAVEANFGHAAVTLLYGGSVTPDNVEALVAVPDIEGFLVGGASLDPTKFAALYAALRSRAS